MSNEKAKILEMIQDGKITATEGMELLKAIEDTDPVTTGMENTDRFLRVRVVGDKTPKVNINIPLGLLKSASKIITWGLNYGTSFIPNEARSNMEAKGVDLTQMDIEEFIRAIDQGYGGKLVDVDVDDEKEGRIKVEVFVD
ncbi:MAG TPA: hypothetical protein VFF14_01850 [Candidatus Deferrimicrobium sp.]|nr:hypothetical protein [Candidatus Deferrimicrobium sp.]